MARRKKIVETKEVEKIPEPMPNETIGVVIPKYIPKAETYQEMMAKKVAPIKKAENPSVIFLGSGVRAVSVEIPHPTVPGQIFKKSYDVDFGHRFRFQTNDEILIKALRGRGYQEE